MEVNFGCIENVGRRALTYALALPILLFYGKQDVLQIECSINIYSPGADSNFIGDILTQCDRREEKKNGLSAAQLFLYDSNTAWLWRRIQTPSVDKCIMDITSIHHMTKMSASD